MIPCHKRQYGVCVGGGGATLFNMMLHDIDLVSEDTRDGVSCAPPTRTRHVLEPAFLVLHAREVHALVPVVHARLLVSKPSGRTSCHSCRAPSDTATSLQSAL